MAERNVTRMPQSESFGVQGVNTDGWKQAELQTLRGFATCAR